MLVDMLKVSDFFKFFCSVHGIDGSGRGALGLEGSDSVVLVGLFFFRTFSVFDGMDRLSGTSGLDSLVVKPDDTEADASVINRFWCLWLINASESDGVTAGIGLLGVWELLGSGTSVSFGVVAHGESTAAKIVLLNRSLIPSLDLHLCLSFLFFFSFLRDETVRVARLGSGTGVFCGVLA